MYRLSLILFLSLWIHSASAAVVDTVSIYSKAMGISKKCVLIIPGKKKKTKHHYPTLYLLHGWSGRYDNWITKVPGLKEYADQYKMIIVCPDGDYSSWYVDSPVDPSMRYETYISTEVPEYIDRYYPTIKDRKARAITGLSMGGHGALMIALKHHDFFSAAGSMSGVVDLNSSRTKYDIFKRIGDTITHADNWKNYSVINLIDQYRPDSLDMIIDCGDADVFFPYNRKLHDKMLTKKIPHDYIERPGGHNWQYWGNAIQYQMLFFREHFDRSGYPSNVKRQR